jgi:ATP-dependent Lon protease
METTLIEFNRKILQNEYTIRTNILRNISVHINNLHNDHLVYYETFCEYLSALNNAIKSLNLEYNKTLRKIKNIDKDLTSSFQNFINIMNIIDSIILNSMHNEYISICEKNIETDYNSFCNDILENKNYLSCIGGFERYSQLFFEKMIESLEYANRKFEYMALFDLSFSEIDNKIKLLVKQTGFLTIDDSLIFFSGKSFFKEQERNNVFSNKLDNYIKSNKNKINDSLIQRSFKFYDIIKNIFIPVKSIVIKNNGESGLVIEKKETCNEINENDPKYKYSILLENCYKITVKLSNPNIAIINIGYFSRDPHEVSLSTSKISVNKSNNIIYFKWKYLQKYISNEIISIDYNFKKNYYKNIKLGQILVFTKNTIKADIEKDYNLYLKYKNMNFKSGMECFLKEKLVTKYNIIRVLLLGDKTTNKNAGFLFSLLKENSINSKSQTLISDLIYNDLTYCLQCKLRKLKYYFREELERFQNLSLNDIDLKRQIIINTTMSDTIKKYAYMKLNEMKNNSNEHYRYYQTIKCLLDYPWINENTNDIFDNCNNNYEKCRVILDKYDCDMKKKIYGHTETVNKIRELIGKWMINSESMGKAIGLCGGPGVGKTFIAQNISNILGIPYEQINVGGLDDASVLNGHSITYSGAQYGLIVKKMCMMGKPRCILFFDELDKACKKHGINEIHNTLVHIIDPNSKDKFNDKFFQDIVFPLSKVLFIFSFNDMSEICQPLLDRMDIVNVDSYSPDEKVIITRDYIIKEIADEYKFERDTIIFNDDVLSYIIDKYTNEGGVRGLKILLENIFAELNLDRIYERFLFKNKKKYSIDNPLVLKISDIEKYISITPSPVKKIYDNHGIGHLSGLYATISGSGGILPIIIHKMYMKLGGSQINITGNQSKVMVESATYSCTVALNCVKKIYRDKFLEKYAVGIHIHTPDGATSKDGPSAGSAFATAFISVILNKYVKKDIAITGEIERSQNISIIGGLEQKIFGAKKAGVKLVFCPLENLGDIVQISKKNPKLIKIWNPNNNNKVKKIIKEINNKNSDDFRVMFVDEISDILKYALIEDVNQVKKNYDTFKSYFDPHIYLK